MKRACQVGNTMDSLLNKTASTVALAAAGLFFLSGLLTGLWKYVCMRRSPDSKAPYYVDVAHRASLMYAFSAHLLAVFASLSTLPPSVNTTAVVLPLIFFALAIVHYVQWGATSTSNNSLRDSKNKNADYMILNALAVAEIGGFSVLLIGFFIRLLAK